MIIRIDELTLRLPGDVSIENTSRLEAKLKALEAMVRGNTHNRFQDKRVRSHTTLEVISTDKTINGADFLLLGFRPGQTVEISDSILNEGLYTVAEVTRTYLKVNEPVIDEKDFIMVTRIVYPLDVVEGVVKLIEYELRMTGKLGIKSEAYSRVSTTYFDMDSNSEEGYPASLLKFLDKYRKLRW